MGKNSMSAKHLFLLCAVTSTLFALAACDADKEVTTASAEVQSAVEAKQAPHRLMVTDKGLGPIDAAMPFNMHKVTVAFPEFSVVEQLNFQEGKSYPVINVSKGAHLLFTVNPTADLKSIYSVVVEDNMISNELTHRIGTLFSDIYTHDKPNSPTCQAGSEELSGKVLCLPPGATNLLYLFAGKWDGPSSQLPPDNIMKGWALDAIIWKPR